MMVGNVVLMCILKWGSMWCNDWFMCMLLSGRMFCGLGDY